MKRKYLLTLTFLLTILFVGAKDPYDVYTEEMRLIDSVKTAIKTAESTCPPDGSYCPGDTTICNGYLTWGEYIYKNYPDTSIMLWQKACDIANSNLTATTLTPKMEGSFLNSLAGALNNIGYIHKRRGEIHKALSYYQRSLTIRKEIADSPIKATAATGKQGVAMSLNNIGVVYYNQGDIEMALEYYHKSLEYYETLTRSTDKKTINIGKVGAASCLNNIGIVFKGLQDFESALEYYSRSLKIKEEMGNKQGMSYSFNNMAVLHRKIGNLEKALEFGKKSLALEQEVGNMRGVATSLNNIGVFYYHHGDPYCTDSEEICAKEGFDLAIEYYHRSAKIREDVGDKEGLAETLNHLGYIYLDKSDYKHALDYTERSYKIAKSLGFPDNIKRSARLFSKIYRKTGDYENALIMYELHIKMRDSINNENTQKAAIRQQTKYNFEKEQLIAEQESKELMRIEEEKNQRRNNLQYSVILIAILALFGGVMTLGFIKVSNRVAEGIIFFSFLILFEFILVLADPYVDDWTGGAPGLKLLINASIAALIFPLHAFFESRIKKQLVKHG